jgi:hypothetical protein
MPVEHSEAELSTQQHVMPSFFRFRSTQLER